MNLTELSFPVFPISNSTITIKEGPALIVMYKSLVEDVPDKILYIDDKSIPGATLGTRRLQLANNGKKLHKLTDAIYLLGDLIKLASLYKRFIDSSGKLFEYRKTKSCKLIYKEIDKVLPIPTGGSIILVKGMLVRFKTIGKVSATSKYISLIVDGPKYILYGVHNKKGVDSWRKI